MSLVSYVLEKDIDLYSNINDVVRLSDAEDVATLIETFEDVKREVGYKKIKTVMQDDGGYYYFVVSNDDGDFDLFEFINKVYVDDVVVSCLNAKILFPETISRGIFDSNDMEESTSDQDNPTGYLDDKNLPFTDCGKLYLRCVRTGDVVDIPKEGLLVGRSSKKVDYLVKGNDNVGRTHCKLYLEGNRLMVHDCNSKNGTFVNNRRVHSDKDVFLVKGDVLLLADEEFKIIS